MSLVSILGKAFSAVGKGVAKTGKTAVKAGAVMAVADALLGSGGSNGKIKGMDLALVIDKATGGKGQVEDKKVITFIKNDYRASKVERREIFRRILNTSGLADEIGVSNNDILMALFNVNSISKINESTPKIKLFSTHFKEMLDTFRLSNKREDQSNNVTEILKNLSETQERIYKILFKIEDELIDEQDTSIKESKKEEESRENFLKRLGDMLEKYIGSKGQGDSDSGGLGALDIALLMSTLSKPFKWLYGKVKDIVTKAVKAIGAGFKKVTAWVAKAFPSLTNALKGAWGKAGQMFSKIGAKVSSVAGAVSNALGKAGSAVMKSIKFMGKHAFQIIDIIFLVGYIAHFWDVAEKSISEPGKIEKIIFSFISGVTAWVQDKIELVGMLSDFVTWASKQMEELHETIIKYLNETSPTTAKLFDVFYKVFSTLNPLPIINKFLIAPVIKWLRDFGAYGVQAGIMAVQAYRDAKDAIIGWATNAIPNTTTFKALFGTDEDLNSAMRKGVYEHNIWGTSNLTGSAKDLYETMTSNELQKILEHDDLSAEATSRVREALRMKAESNNDQEVKENLGGTPQLQALYNTITTNSSWIGVSKLTAQTRELWTKLVKASMTFVKTNPTACFVQARSVNGKWESSTNRSLVNDDYDHIDEKPSISLIIGILKAIQSQGVEVKPYSDQGFMFTAFGTLFTIGIERDVLKSKSLIPNLQHFNPRSDGTVGIFYQVLGSFGTNGRFEAFKIAKGDAVFAKYTEGTSILTDSNVDFQTSQAKAVSIPSHIARYGNIDNEVTPAMSSPIPAPQPGPNFSGMQISNPPITKIPNVSPNEASSKVWAFLKKCGFTDEQAAGIMGNLDVESGGFGKAMFKVHWDSNGPSGGLCQWHDTMNALGKGRLTALLRFAGWSNDQINAFYNNIRLNNWKGELPIDLDTQLAFLMHELNSSHKSTLNGGKNWIGVKNSTDVAQSANSWVRGFERPANMDQEAFKRAERGMGWLKKYAGSQGNQEPEGGATPTGGTPTPTGGAQSASGGTPTGTSPGSSSTPPSYIPQGSQTEYKGDKSTMEHAADYATSKAGGSSIGYCARYVANALQAVGFKFTRQGSAYMYHTNGILKNLGFGLVSVGQQGYTPQKGDVCVINRFMGSKNHPHGHICIYNGTQWVSDFRQRKASPYKYDNPGEQNMFFYRYGGPDTGVTPSYSVGSPSTGASGGSPMGYAGSPRDTGIPQGASNSAPSPSSPDYGPPVYEGDAEKLFGMNYASVMV
jgi:hypothetical protein